MRRTQDICFQLNYNELLLSLITTVCNWSSIRRRACISSIKIYVNYTDILNDIYIYIYIYIYIMIIMVTNSFVASIICIVPSYRPLVISSHCRVETRAPGNPARTLSDVHAHVTRFVNESSRVSLKIQCRYRDAYPIDRTVHYQRERRYA